MSDVEQEKVLQTTWPLLIVGGLLGALAAPWLGWKAAVFPAAALAIYMTESRWL